MTCLLRYCVEEKAAHDAFRLQSFLQEATARMRSADDADVDASFHLLRPRGLDWTPSFVSSLVPELTREWYLRGNDLNAVYDLFVVSQGSYQTLCVRSVAFLGQHCPVLVRAGGTPHLLYERVVSLSGLLYLCLRAFRVAVLQRVPKSAKLVGSLHNCGRILGNVSLHCLKCKQLWCSRGCQKEEWSRHVKLHHSLCGIETTL